MSVVSDFLARIQAIHATGHATEHSYRAAFQALFTALDAGLTIINEPKRIACGAPDLIIQRGAIAIGHLEAKDVPVNIHVLKDANKAQQSRYLKALPNLIYSNGLDWDFFRDGEPVAQVSIARLEHNAIIPAANQFATLESLLRDFIAQRPQTITSPKELAEHMAGKAQLIKEVMKNALLADAAGDTELAGQFNAFKTCLIHDITPDDFADLYAETLAYGLFAARLHDTTLETFSRQEALTLLPRTNPFLRSLFGYIAGPELDERLAWIIDDLAVVFQAANVRQIMDGFGELTGRSDPFLHFYETFLAAYSPQKRKARGVWYTPEAVVHFIVRAVDDLLKQEFNLADGLADTSKVTVDWDTGQNDKKGKPVILKKNVHRVQLLDPATGTGTFLAEAIKQLAPRIRQAAPGLWSNYVEGELIPRLHGFELLMASYTMCHMKLDMVLTELDYTPTANPPRLGVYLTNSLEEAERDVRDLFMAQWLTREARDAAVIKRQTPIMVVLGNPPYAGESSNKGDWIMGLMEAYKKEPGGKQKLDERNPKWINDDYVKFIRLAEHLIDKNGEGVIGYITNHGYLDNPTFRGMRWHLLHTFDMLYVLDLHGNSKKKEVAPGGESDQNVFDIMQGVAILLAVKKKTAAKQKPLARVFHADLWGSRTHKYEMLFEAGIHTDFWQELTPSAPQYFFVPRDEALLEQYQKGFSVQEFLPVHGNGIVTKRDKLNVRCSPNEVLQVVEDFLTLGELQVRAKYNLPKDVRDWRYEWALNDIRSQKDNIPVQEIQYRLFDNRFIFYSGHARGLIGWPVTKVMSHYIAGGNVGLLTSKAHCDASFAHAFVTTKPTEAILLSGTTGSNAMNFPLYLYADDGTRTVNFDPALHRQLVKLATDATHGAPDELACFDYIYGVLHSPAYRDTYAEFLKSDFPRIPWPESPAVFWQVADAGSQLRRLHLMEADAIGTAPYPFTGAGDAVIDKPGLSENRIHINKTQYFDQVPDGVWEFHIGGYQPAQKWLKDRKGQALTFADIQHYQRLLKVLAETRRLMAAINLPLT